MGTIVRAWEIPGDELVRRFAQVGSRVGTGGALFFSGPYAGCQFVVREDVRHLARDLERCAASTPEFSEARSAAIRQLAERGEWEIRLRELRARLESQTGPDELDDALRQFRAAVTDKHAQWAISVSGTVNDLSGKDAAELKRSISNAIDHYLETDRATIDVAILQARLKYAFLLIHTEACISKYEDCVGSWGRSPSEWDLRNIINQFYESLWGISLDHGPNLGHSAVDFLAESIKKYRSDVKLFQDAIRLSEERCQGEASVPHLSSVRLQSSLEHLRDAVGEVLEGRAGITLDWTAAYYRAVMGTGNLDSISTAVHSSNEVRFFFEQLPGNTVGLDVGCGEGGLMAMAADLGHTFHGLELTPELVTLVNSRSDLGEARAQVGNALALPVGDGSVNALVLAHVLIHLSQEDGTAALKEAYRALAPGGQMLLTTNVVEHKGGSTERTLHSELQGFADPIDFYKWDLTELLKTLKDLGLRVRKRTTGKNWTDSDFEQIYLHLEKPPRKI